MTKRLTDAEILRRLEDLRCAGYQDGSAAIKVLRDALAYRRALRTIAHMCGNYGNGVTHDMVVREVSAKAKRALGDK